MAGPKTRHLDGKVPEGCYTLTWQNVWSDYYLGYLISYPEPADVVRRDHWQSGGGPGGSIVLHGDQVTIGCIPVGNAAIEELYLLLNRNWSKATRYGRLRVFPCRFGPEKDRILTGYPSRLVAFWDSLRPIYRYFHDHQQIPHVSHDPDTGYYRLEP